jgi:disintegrin and metalloproteinase domain-containing protein 17
VKRGAKPSINLHNKIREVEFTALGRKFKLILHPHRDVLHQNFRAYAINSEGNETIIHVDHDSFFRGRVFGEISSHVSAHIDDGNVLTATIILPEETYHIEPSWRHLPESTEKHMVAYKASDVKLSWENHDHSEHFEPGKCGYVKEGLELETDEDDDEYPEARAEAYGSNEPQPKSEKRSKRQADQYEYTPTKTRCPLLLVADYRFFQEMGSSNTKTTISYLISLIDRVHKIYNDTIWQDRDADGFRGMGFVIKKILVHSEPTKVRGGEAHYNMIREKWDVRNLLEVRKCSKLFSFVSQLTSFLTL